MLQASPGSTIKDVAIALAVTHSTATYHLLTLARLGMLEQVRDGRELRHFLVTDRQHGGIPARKREFVHALARQPKAAMLLAFLAANPIHRMTLNQVADGVGLSFGFVRRTLLRLQDMGLVDVVRRNYRYHLVVTPELRHIFLNITMRPPG